MTVQYSRELLERYFAPGIDDCRPKNLRNLSTEIVDNSWLQNHFLNSIFGHKLSEEWRARFVVLAFRNSSALAAYERARLSCETFVDKSVDGHPATRAYFDAIANWEMAILNVHHAIDVFRQLEGVSFDEDADSANLREIANRIKHCAEDIQSGKHGALTIPMWMTGISLKTRTSEVSFCALAESIVSIAKTLEELQNPTTLRSKGRLT